MTYQTLSAQEQEAIKVCLLASDLKAQPGRFALRIPARNHCLAAHHRRQRGPAPGPRRHAELKAARQAHHALWRGRRHVKRQHRLAPHPERELLTQAYHADLCVSRR